MTDSILWRRTDTPGHDACRLQPMKGGWALQGTAVFRHEEMVAQLSYQVASDLSWNSLNAYVHGWVGAERIEHTITRTAEREWTLNGALVPGLDGCVDLDLGFTPATNLLPLRRLALAEGQAADAPAAWLDLSSATLEALPQRYERRSETTYWYEAPTVGYAALLEVTPIGFIRRYPGLWEAEA